MRRAAAVARLVFAFLIIAGLAARAEEAAATAESGNTPAPKKDDVPWLIEHTDYSGDWLTRPAMSGNWNGDRQKLMDSGVRFDVAVTQVMQDVASGGKEECFRYQGAIKYGFQLDTDKAGLWAGGMLVADAQSNWGYSANRKTGALMYVDSVPLWPDGNDDATALTNLYYVQFVTPWLGLMAGRMSPRDANVFAHDETEQFMNSAFMFNMVMGTTVPLVFLGGGAIILPTQWLKITTLAIDSEGKATQTGFDTCFERGTTVFQQWEFAIKPFGLEGHQRISWTWSDRRRIQFSQNPRAVREALVTGDTSGLRREGSDWSVFYDFDQYVWNVPGSKDRGLGVFARLGAGNDSVNPVEQFYSLGLVGKGLIPQRQRDHFGIGYYYLQLSSQLPRELKRRSRDEQGLEVYYNCAVTPWCQITPDVQVLRPVSSATDTTVVLGMRVKVIF